MDAVNPQEALELTIAQCFKFREMVRDGQPMTAIAAALGLPYMRLTRWARRNGYQARTVRTIVEWDTPEDEDDGVRS